LYDLPLALCRIVLSNLIRNAFEHTLSGTVCVQQNELHLVITNTSSGLSNDYQKVRERDLSHGQGFGIGLDIVKKIADQQKWQLQLSSSYSNGSQVQLFFEGNVE
jgi:signal transduction histidine kinase